MSIELVFGVSGAIVVLVAFIANQSSHLKNDSFIYDFLNFFGSVLLFVYAFLLESAPFMIVNFVWGFISAIDVVKYILKVQNKK